MKLKENATASPLEKPDNGRKKRANGETEPLAQ